MKTKFMGQIVEELREYTVVFSCALFERESEKSRCGKVFTELAEVFDHERLFESSIYRFNSNLFSQKCFAQLSKLVTVRSGTFLTI